jgi:Tfp pilus assembly protein PilF
MRHGLVQSAWSYTLQTRKPAARDAIERAVEIAVDDPALHEARGDVYLVGGAQRWFDARQRQAHYRQAVSSYRESLRLRPTDPQTWASLAAAHFGAREFGAPLQEAWTRALALGPHEGYVQSMLMDLALATWADATPAMRQWVEDTFENAPESTRVEINKMAEQRGLRLSVAASAPAPDVK